MGKGLLSQYQGQVGNGPLGLLGDWLLGFRGNDYRATQAYEARVNEELRAAEEARRLAEQRQQGMRGALGGQINEIQATPQIPIDQTPQNMNQWDSQRASAYENNQRPVTGLLGSPNIPKDARGILNAMLQAGDVEGAYTNAIDLAMPQAPDWKVVGDSLANVTAPGGPQFVQGPQDPKDTISGDYIWNGQSWVANPDAETLARAKATNISIDNRTPGDDALDRAVATDIANFTYGGGYADAAKNIQQLHDVLDVLRSGENVTGPVVGRVPGPVRTFTNPASINTQEQVEEVVQRNLREILGAQFTEREGIRLISRAYNPALEESINIPRVERLLNAMEQAYQAKVDAARYFEQNRTMQGYTGKLWTLGDIEAAAQLDKPPEEERAATGPQPGTIEDGYRYVGGDPASPNSWVKVQ